MTKRDFDHSNLFEMLKTTFCKYCKSIKIKISMTCVHKEYEVKINMVQEQWQLKVFAPKKKFFLSYNMKIVIYWESLLVGIFSGGGE